MKLGRKATAMALSAATLFSLVVPVSAATKNDGKSLSITKELQMPEGVTTPNTDFTFDFTATGYKSNQGDNLDATIKGPAINSQTIHFDKKMTGSVDNETKYVVKDTNDILPEFSTANLTKPGYYFYTVKEKTGTYDYTKDTSVTTENYTAHMQYSLAEYDVVFTVVKGTDGNLKVDSSTVTTKKDDAGNEIPKKKIDGTVNPDKSDTGKKEDEKGNKYGNEFRFINKFNRKNGSDKTDPTNPQPGKDPKDAGLWLGKYVTGALGDTTKYFDFTVKVTNPKLKTDAVKDTYKAYIVKNTGTKAAPTYVSVTKDEAKIVSTDAQLDATKNLYYVELTSGAAKSVKLKDNFAMAAYEVATGSKFEMSESNPGDGYSTTLELFVNGQMIAGKTLASSEQLLGDQGKNTAFFTNTKENTPFTGLFINNLPFIIMALVAVSAFGLVLLTNVKKARRSEN